MGIILIGFTQLLGTAAILYVALDAKIAAKYTPKDNFYEMSIKEVNSELKCLPNSLDNSSCHSCHQLANAESQSKSNAQRN